MRAVALLALCTLMLGCISSHADELDGWCAQVTKASSIVICSDNQLRQQALTRNKLFDVARQKLTPEDYKALTEEQTRWIRSYTTKCGVPLDGPSPPIPVSQSVVECFRRESEDRTAHLYARLIAILPNGGSGTSTVSSTPSSPGSAPALPAQTTSQHVMDEWYSCLYDAADTLSEQPESAKTVAEASFGSCSRYENAYLEVYGGIAFHERLERIKAEIMAPRVLSRVMVDRAARAKLGNKPPAQESKSEGDYHKM